MMFISTFLLKQFRWKLSSGKQWAFRSLLRPPFVRRSGGLGHRIDSFDQEKGTPLSHLYAKAKSKPPGVTVSHFPTDAWVDRD